MVSREPIENIYTKNELIIKNSLFDLYKAEINLNNFNYDLLYAYTQVSGVTLNKRTTEAEKFAKKLSEKNLDNQTIRTILETQNIKLPQNIASFIEANNCIDNNFFTKYHNLLLYIHHPNLVTIYASDSNENSLYVATEDLNQNISTEKLFETFTQEGKINLVIQVSRAVACLHSNKILHGNICPDNIFALVKEGGICQIKLLAGGLVPDIDTALETGGGSEFKPAFAFMSPENLLRRDNTETGPEEDIYALGCLLYFYLSGQHPWHSFRTLFDILEECKTGNKALNDNSFENIPVNLKAIILKAIHSDTAKRYLNVAEFIEDLEACRDGNNPKALALLEETPPNAAADKTEENVEQAPNITEKPAPKTDNNPLTDIASNINDIPVQKKLKAEDLPQPFNEPEIPNIDDISANLNKTSSQVWKKMLIAAAVIAGLAGGSYIFLNNQKEKNSNNAEAENEIQIAEKEQNDISLTEEKDIAEEKTAEDTVIAEEAESITAEKEAAINDIVEVIQEEENNDINIPTITREEPQEKEVIETETPAIDPEIEKQKLIEEEYQTAIIAGNEAMKAKNYALAIVEYNNAVNLKNTIEAGDLLQVADIKEQQRNDFENHLLKAGELLTENNLEEAQITIINAKNIPGYNEDPRTDKILEEIKQIQFDTTFDEANSLLAAGNFHDAIIKFAWALSIEGYENHPDALNGKRIAEETIIQIEKKKAEAEAEKRNRLAQYNAAMAEAEKLFSQKRWDEAVAAYDAALKVPDYQNNPEALSGKQNTLNSKLEEERLAIELEKQQLKAQYAAYIKNANTYLAAGLWSEAEKEFSKSLEIEGYAQSEEAANGRKAAIEQNRQKINREQYDALLLKGMQNIASKSYPESEKAFRDALLIPGFDNAELARQGIMFAEDLNRIVTRAEKYNNYINAGKENLINKNAADAARDFGRAIVEAPNQINAYILRGSAYLEAGDADRAIGNFNQALEIEPNFEAAQIGKAIAFFKNKNYEKAFTAFSELEDTTVDSIVRGDSEAAIGWMYLENEDNSYLYDNQQAYDYFIKASDDDNNVAWNNLGYMLMNGIATKKNYDEAIEYFQQAADTGQPEALFNLGMAYYKGNGIKRNYETAFKYFMQAAETETLPIAWGQVAEMYRRGRGVKKNKNLMLEMSEKYNDKTNKDTKYLIAKPKILIPLPEEQLSTNVDMLELEKQYAGIKDSARKLLENNNYAAAARVYKLATYLDGYQDSDELNSLITAAEEKLSAKISTARNSITAIPTIAVNKPVIEEVTTEITENIIEKEPATAASGNTELDRILNSIELASENIDSNTTIDNDELDIDFENDVPENTPAKTSKFMAEYNTLIAEAEKSLSAQEWEIAEQAFRLALALPDSPDQGDAAAGLKTAITEKKKAYENGKSTASDNIAILSNATTLLRDEQWPQAIYLYNSIIESDVGKLAAIGKEISEAINDAINTPDDLPQIGADGDTRDVASYNMALKQSKQFLADNNYGAAIQMLEIVLNMDGYTDDAVAAAMLDTAKNMQLEHDNSPEALALKREKNKPIFDKLISSGDVYLSAGNYNGALDSYNLALKIPGYAKDAETVKAIQNAENLMSKPPVSAEARAEYNALMTQGRDALESENWIRAEETFRVILSLSDFKEDPDAMSGLKAAASAQNKPVPEVGNIDEELLQNGLIPADADLEEVRRRAEFEALLREGKRQMELMQYEVAEAMFNEALKIEGYTVNRDAMKLLQETISLKPKQKEIEIPEHPEEELSPEQDMQHQASLLLDEGNRLRAQKKFESAIQAYSNGIDLDRNNPQLRINRADTYAGISNFDLALNDYNKVLEYDSADNEVKSYTWNNIANVYYYGKKDYSSAVEFYRKAAEAGNVASMNSLGVCYGFGKGVEKDPAESLKWYTEAAENDYANAMLNLGLMYQNGWGIESDMQKALNWYEKAAERNIPRAFIRLSLMYQNGTGVEVDLQKAEDYKAQARELGYTADR